MKYKEMKDRDVVPYLEGQDNAQVYREHELLRDQHDNFLHKQATKDVHEVLAPNRRKTTMTKEIREDIHIRAGVLPPTQELDLNSFQRTEAQERAAREREALEPAMKQKRKQSQLMKMKSNLAYQTPAGKRAIEIALTEE